MLGPRIGCGPAQRRALWSADLSPLTSRVTNLWSMGESTGTRYDAVGGVHLTGYGAPFGPLSTPGINGLAAQFLDENLQSLRAASFAPPGGTGSFSCYSWFQTVTAQSANVGLIDCSNGSWPTAASASLYNASTGSALFNLVFLVSDGLGSYVLASNGSLPWSVGWHLAVGTYDSSDRKVRIYLDGVFGGVSSALAGTARYNVPTPLWLGKHGALSYTDFNLGECGFLTGAMTASEVAAVWRSGLGRFYPYPL